MPLEGDNDAVQFVEVMVYRVRYFTLQRQLRLPMQVSFALLVHKITYKPPL